MRDFFVVGLGNRSIFGLVLSLLCLDSNILGLGDVFCLSNIFGLGWSLDFFPLPFVLGILSPLPLVTNLARVLWDPRRGKRGLGGKRLLY